MAPPHPAVDGNRGSPCLPRTEKLPSRKSDHAATGSCVRPFALLRTTGMLFHGTPTFLMAAAYGGKSDFKIFRLLSASSARNSRPV